MFNQSGFNDLPFNTTYDVNVYANFYIGQQLEQVIDISMIYSLQFNMHDELESEFDGLRDHVGAFVMETALETIFNGVTEKFAQFNIECDLQMSFDGTRYRIEQIEYTGDFAPGDKIVIDNEKLKFTQNGQNALHLMQGDFFNLNDGTNHLEYTDDQTGRTVRMRVSYEDRFIG
jgi:phage-related protein